MNPTAPPASLGKAGRALWQSIMTEYGICDIAWLENELMTADVHLAADVTARAVKRAIATQTLRRAREKLNVRAYQQPGKSPPVWLWSLTPADDFDFG